jgi:hypothetical protein
VEAGRRAGLLPAPEALLATAVLRAVEPLAAADLRAAIEAARCVPADFPAGLPCACADARVAALPAGTFVVAAFPATRRPAVPPGLRVAPCTAGFAAAALFATALPAAVFLAPGPLAAAFFAGAFFAGVFRAVALLAAAFAAAGRFAAFLPVDAGMRALAMLPPPSCGRGRDGDSDSTAGIHSG